jgi:3-phenylpropionate/trans-cinnamate dioxygenase ferredoxin reductase subunit
MPDKIVIAGAGHAAGQLVASLMQKKHAGQIVLLGDEPWLPYQRPPLSKKFLAGELAAERLFVKPAEFYENDQLEILLDTRVEHIDRAGRQLRTSAGNNIGYDKLVLALGSTPRQIDLPGVDLAGVSYLRSIADVERIRSSLADARQMVIVGAGYIGLEVAAVVCKMGIDVTVVEAQDRVMSRVVSPQVSAFYEKVHRENGVQLLLSTGVAAFVGDERVTAVELDNGDRIPADAVIVGVGVVPNTAIAESAGLVVNNGIVVNTRCATSDPDIFAVGDCTLHPNPLLGRDVRLESVHNALEQAKTAAASLCGQPTEYAQVPWFWSDQYDLKLQIVGLSEGYDDIVIRGEPASSSFSCLYLKKGRLIAIDAVNNPRDFMQSKKLVADGAIIDRAQLANAALALKDMSYAGPG